MEWFTAKNVVSLFFVFVGLTMIYSYLRNVIRVRASAHWPKSRGTVTASWVREDLTASIFTNCFPQVRYAYHVQGQEYRGNKVTFGAQEAKVKAKAMAVVSKYSPGSNVTVYYDPQKPSRAVLERNVSKIMLFYGALCIGAGILFFVWAS